MSKYTWRELEPADIDAAASHAAEMEYRAEQIANEAQKRLARAEHIVNGLGEVNGEIVRCRDCKFANWDIFAWWCTRDKYQPFKIGELRDERDERSHLDGFCKWGIKK